MPKFVVTVGRDATVYYKATIEAESLEDVQDMLHKTGLDCPEDTVWEEAGVEPFNNVETCMIEDENEQNILSEWKGGDSWT